ncbi:carbamoyl-phosphate synthase large subunit [Candidatus Roizmanbacteria bacterium]|nr:carbamoyl-phosphate synthase large subunit [Candidatus Roizmanbacteria bacterium]
MSLWLKPLAEKLQLKTQNYKLDYYVIEVNARLSRSSALASKATGYPLAYVAAKIATGKRLSQIQNQVTKVTQSFFEPALDYCVVKIPRWDIEKFRGASETIGSSMKSVGEVMGIGRRFEEALQKAVRMLEIGAEGVTDWDHLKNSNGNGSVAAVMKHHIERATPKRLFALAYAMREGITVDQLYKTTGIDPWFLERVKEIVEIDQYIKSSIQQISNHQKNNAKEKLLELKQLGFSDRYIARRIGSTKEKIRVYRKKLGIVPSIFQIDTLAGEFPAQTNYLYLTYNGTHHDVAPLKKKGVIVLGSGPYRIGSSVEFDWSCVNTAMRLKKYGKESIIVNCNPETVSTDYDMSRRLYFEELSYERVMDIYEFEESDGVICSVGGQTPNTVSQSLHRAGVRILGTYPADIDRAEDRNKFSDLLDKLHVRQPAWISAKTIVEAESFAEKAGYPVLIRPSYVLSGVAMRVCYTRAELETYLHHATRVNKEYPVTISKFMREAKEIEYDGVAQNGEILVYGISEHIEHAGVHSGDATIVFPPQHMYLRTKRRVEEIATALVRELDITGPFNIQFLAKDNHVSVIELNLRASRTFPFLSKATGVNFARTLVDAIFDPKVSARMKPVFIHPDFAVVKSPQFSFSRITGADPTLHVEMASTGEVGCFGDTFSEALLKSELSVGGTIPEKGVFISVGGAENKVRFLETAYKLKQLTIPLYATEKTAQFLRRNDIQTRRLYKLHEKKSPNLLTYLQNRKIDLVINIVDPHLQKDMDDDVIIRRAVVDHNVYLITNRLKAIHFVKALVEKKLPDLVIKAWGEYLGNT